MTKFQRSCLTELKNKLIDSNYELNQLEEIYGQTENYIFGKVGNISFWIYEDMADFKYNNRNLIFELPDYKSADELIRSYVDEIVRVLKSEAKE